MTTNLSVADCIDFIVTEIRKKDDLFSEYGYEVYINKVTRIYVTKVLLTPHQLVTEEHDRFSRKYSRQFIDAAWQLCRLGILRPGVCSYGRQSVEDGGTGFSLTTFGITWIQKGEDEFLIPCYSRFSEILEPFKVFFGESYLQRALEAAQCFQTQCYLACCSMCGAAAESIILKIGSEKFGDEESLKIYQARSGRNELKKKICMELKPRFAKDFEDLMNLLLYWRDESSHGSYSEIDSNEAFMALNHLYRLANFTSKNWNLFIEKKTN